MLIIFVLLCGCTANVRYYYASKELLHRSESLTWSCWRKLEPETEPVRLQDAVNDPREGCADELAQKSINICIGELKQAGIVKPKHSAAKSELELCMKSKGWELHPFIDIYD